MFGDAWRSLRAAIKMLAAQRILVLLAFFLYLVLIGVIYLFITTREASIVQVLLSAVLFPLLAVELFFMLQGIALGYVSREMETRTLLGQAAKNAWRLFVISLPLLLIAWLIVKGIDQLDWRVIHYKAISPYADSSSSSNRNYQDWYLIASRTMRFVLLYVALPLLAARLWISVAREGVRETLRRIGSHLLRAFAPRAVLIYGTCLAVFGAMAYLLLFTRTPAENPWVEIGLLSTRIALALIVVFIGWLIAIGALAKVHSENASLESK